MYSVKFRQLIYFPRWLLSCLIRWSAFLLCHPEKKTSHYHERFWFLICSYRDLRICSWFIPLTASLRLSLLCSWTLAVPCHCVAKSILPVSQSVLSFVFLIKLFIGTIMNTDAIHILVLSFDAPMWTCLLDKYLGVGFLSVRICISLDLVSTAIVCSYF